MLFHLVIGYVMFSLLCGAALVFMVIGDRSHSRTFERREQDTSQGSTELHSESQEHPHSTVSADDEKLQRYG
jgi:hypothetical protein